MHGARHDAHAFAASGLTKTLADIHTLADLGYLDDDGIDLAPIRKRQAEELHQTHAAFNTQLSKISARRGTCRRSPQTWRMLSEEDGRYRAPIAKYASMLKPITGLYFFTAMNKPPDIRAWVSSWNDTHPTSPG